MRFIFLKLNQLDEDINGREDKSAGDQKERRPTDMICRPAGKDRDKDATKRTKRVKKGEMAGGIGLTAKIRDIGNKDGGDHSGAKTLNANGDHKDT